jgi:5'/3'-nucleotidase SurE
MDILLTNDDNHRSPLFEFITAQLTAFGTLKIVVPKEEQSWTGKSITRFRNLFVDEIRLFGHSAQCLAGTLELPLRGYPEVLSRAVAKFLAFRGAIR